MAKKLDSKETVSFKELLMSKVINQRHRLIFWRGVDYRPLVVQFCSWTSELKVRPFNMGKMWKFGTSIKKDAWLYHFRASQAFHPTWKEVRYARSGLF